MPKKITRYILLFLIAFLGGSLSVFAQTKTWTGAVSNDWHTAGNWNPSGVPGSSDNVVLRNNTTPYPVITQNVTINNLTTNDWWNNPGDELFIDNGATFTVNGNMVIRAHSALHILDGHFNVTSTSAKVVQGVINIGNGSATFNSNLEIANGTGQINLTHINSELTVNGLAQVKHILNIEKGLATFNTKLYVGNGGTLYQDEGEILVNGEFEVGGTGDVYLGNGDLTVNGNTKIASTALLDVQDAEMYIDGNLIFTGDGHLNIDSGSLTATGNTDVVAGATVNLDTGELNMEGNLNIAGGSLFGSDDANISLGGDFSLARGSDFEIDTGTFTFNGDGTQTITSYVDLDFYDVVIGPNSTVETAVDGSTITINNDLEVDSGGEINVNGNDKLNVKGLVEGDDDVLSLDYPYAVTAALDQSLNFVDLGFNLTMDPATSTNIANYVVKDRASGQTLTVTGASLNTGGDNQIVTLTISGIQQGENYVIIMNNITATNGKSVSPNHEKFFPLMPAEKALYSRVTGDWDVNSSWSFAGHSGPAANTNPEASSNYIIIIGDGHTITVTNPSGGSIANHVSVTVDNNSTLLVDESEFNLGKTKITGDGTFELDGGHLIIGSPEGISASGATGNVQTANRNFDSSGGSSFTYTNANEAQIIGTGLPNEVTDLTIDNAYNVTADRDIVINNDLNLDNGRLIIKSGYSLVANNKNYTGTASVEMQREISGGKGWRLFSTPVGNSYSDFFTGLTTQGYTGSSLGLSANSEDLQPNVLWYKEDYPGTDNQRWRTPGDADDTIPTGLGLYTYVFGNVTGDNRYNDNLPVTLSAIGKEPNGTIDFGVTYTAAADSGWNLVGNPYTASIDWDDAGAWTKTNIDATIYMWDYDTSQYKTWNGSTGDLPSQGLIAPFQGFWVKANDASPKLEVKESAKTTGGVFVGKISRQELESAPSFSITLSDGSNAASTHFMFSDAGKLDKDTYDAYRLLPPPGINSYIDLASISENGERFSINNLPRKFGMPIEIKLSVDAFDNGFSTDKDLMLGFENFKNIPNGWKVSLIDRHENKEIIMNNGLKHPFKFKQKKGKTAPNGDLNSGKPKITYKEKAVDNRFYIRIVPGEDAADLPENFALEQNYPNPFNPSTKIQFALPLQSYTNLTIYDMLGRKVITLVNDELPAGIHTYEWNAGNAASGIYFYRLHTNNAVISKKMTLIK